MIFSRCWSFFWTIFDVFLCSTLSRKNYNLNGFIMFSRKLKIHDFQNLSIFMNSKKIIKILWKLPLNYLWNMHEILGVSTPGARRGRVLPKMHNNLATSRKFGEFHWISLNSSDFRLKYSNLRPRGWKPLVFLVYFIVSWVSGFPKFT